MPLPCHLASLSHSNTQRGPDREEHRKTHNEGRWSMHHTRCKRQPLEEQELCLAPIRRSGEIGRASLASPLVTQQVVVHPLQRALFQQRPCPSQAISLC